jgi:hypothetical protein
MINRFILSWPILCVLQFGVSRMYVSFEKMPKQAVMISSTAMTQDRIRMDLDFFPFMVRELPSRRKFMYGQHRYLIMPDQLF